MIIIIIIIILSLFSLSCAHVYHFVPKQKAVTKSVHCIVLFGV